VSFRLRTIASDRKACDAISLDLLARVIPPKVVDDVLAAYDARTRRTRKLSQSATVFLLLAVTLHSHLAIRDVVKRLWRASAFLWPSRLPAPPAVSAVCYRREQLGVRPLAALFRLVCRPLASSATKGAFRFGLRLVAIDGTKEEVANTPANERAFGRNASQRGPAAFVQILCVYLVEVGTHAIFDAVFWPWDRSEAEAAGRLVRSLTADMLVMVDRGLYSYNFVEAVRERHAHVLARISSCVKPQPIRTLADGSVLARIRPNRGRKGQTKRRKVGTHHVVRVISYTMTDPTQPGCGEIYRVLTTIIDERQAPALDVARCYHERWEIELVIDEVDEHQRLSGRPLRSKTPVGVMQEMYALVIAHYVVRALMHEAAVKADLDPDRLSFVGALHVVQDLIPQFAIVSRAQRRRLGAYLLDEIARERLPERRPRAYPRVIRRKMSKWPLKRDKHKHWPQPTMPLHQRLRLI
jgi:hypothetical protein